MNIEHIERITRAMEASGEGFWDWNFKNGKLIVSHDWLSMLGYAESDFNGRIRFWKRICHPNDRPALKAMLAAIVAGSRPTYELEHRLRHRDGSWVWVISRAKVALRDDNGSPVHVIGTNSDVTGQKAQSEALRQSEERFRAATGAMHDGLILQNRKGETVICNQRAREILGLTAEQLSGSEAIPWGWSTIRPDGSDWPMEEHPGRMALEQGKPFWNVLMGVRKPDKSLAWLNVNADPIFREGESEPYKAVVTFDDITERRRLEEEKDRLVAEALARADRDPLTDLFNHRTFHDRLRLESARVRSEGGSLAVVVLDMDNFKFFNETYGHLIGDEVLGAAANVLRLECRDEDIIARIGGDEFALLLPRANRMDAWACAERLRNRVHSLTFQPKGEASPVPLRLSIGMAVIPDETVSYSEALYIADKRASLDKDGDLRSVRSEELRVSLRDSTEGFAMLDALVAAVDNKDRYTRQHSEDVMCLSGMIGRAMDLPDEIVKTLEIAALVHDVGKIGVPVRMLRQPGVLSDSEFDAIRQHTNLGAILVGAVAELSHTLDAVRYHHERWDGSGYPFGLAGEEIPLSARIMAVADAFSAMTTDRPYRVAMDTERALGILEAGAGRQWDPAIVDVFAGVCRRMSPVERETSLFRRDDSLEGSRKFARK